MLLLAVLATSLASCGGGGNGGVGSSRTLAHSILASAAPGAAKGSVVLDNANTRVAIVMQAHGYITFRGLSVKSSLKNAIANGSQAANAVADPALLSIGVVVEDCEFSGVTTADAGDNIAAIGMWITQDWLVRNNLIEGVPAGSGIRAYGVINALIEHNTIRNVSSGVMWKDHFVGSFGAVMDRYSPSSVGYSTLAAWQAATGAGSYSLGFNGPDAGSKFVAYSSSLFASDKPYFQSASSPAKGMLPDGSNAGPYQLGSETIGTVD